MINNKAKRIGLMGCGAVANYGHIPTIQATEGLELYAIYEPNEETLERTRQKFGVQHAYSDALSFFESGIDAVSITSPAPCHKENVLEAARHGLPALCEKPLAMNADEGKEMISAMKTAGVSLYTAFCYRFSPSALKIRELVRNKAIGDVRSLRLIFNWNLHGKFTTDACGERVIQKRREGRMLEGGPMVDCGAHQIDLATFWLNSEVTDFSSHGAWVDDYEAPDHLWLHMDHVSGAHSMIEMSYSYHHTSKHARSEFVYELIGTDGVIRYDRNAKTFRMENVSGTTELEFFPEKSFSGMYAEWANALTTGSSSLLTSAEEGMRVTDIARQATDSAIRNRRTTPAAARQ